MFGFGFSKLVVLIAIVVAVWYGFKYVGQLDRARKQGPSRPPRRAASGGGGRTPEVEDTVQCPVCGAYVVAKTATPCERPDCPY
jgi:uncharacterized protein